jgi:hypothetical protein
MQTATVCDLSAMQCCSGRFTMTVVFCLRQP